MFKESINETPFSTAEADSFFVNITQSGSFGDKSFITTARILLDKRIEQGFEVNLRKTQTRTTHEKIAAYSVRDALIHALPECLMAYDNLFLIENCVPAEDFTSSIALLKSSLESEFPEWKEVKKIREFYKKRFEVLCYVNESKRSTIIYTHRLSLKEEHALQISLPLFLPWYFTSEKPLKKDETEFLKSLTEESPEKYMSLVEKFAKGYDFRRDRIERLLAGFSAGRYISQKSLLEKQLQTLLGEIKRLENSIHDKMNQCDNTEILIEGLTQKINTSKDDNEIIDYFVGNKHLVLENTSDGMMTFCVIDYITYFDEEKAEKYINRMMDTSRKKLLKAVFLDGILKVRVCAAFELEPSSGVRGKTHYYYPRECDNYLPNPHIESYGCMAGYITTIDEAIRNYDYITAVEQCAASAKSLNFSDNTVMSRFESLLVTETGNRFFETKDGTLLNTEEALEFLKGLRNE